MTEPNAIDWSDDEQVVRAAVPECYRNGRTGEIWADRHSRVRLGRDWHEAHQHSAVQAFERQHRPASPVAAEQGKQGETSELAMLDDAMELLNDALPFLQTHGTQTTRLIAEEAEKLLAAYACPAASAELKTGQGVQEEGDA